MADIKQEIGIKIREARKVKGITQKELGERLGVSESAVNRYEKGVVNASIGALVRIAQELDVVLDITFKKA